MMKSQTFISASCGHIAPLAAGTALSGPADQDRPITAAPYSIVR